MLVTYGERLFGRTDVVSGLGHVASEFFHISYVPIVPLASYLVLENGHHERIAMNLRSIATVYARTITLLVGCSMVAAAPIAIASPRRGPSGAGSELFVVSAIVAMVGVLLAASTWIFGRALREPTRARRAELLRGYGHLGTNASEVFA